MRAYALIESRRAVIWPLWSGALALFVTLGVPPLALCLASGALMAGRVLEAADRVSAERCRRVMSVVGLVTTPVAAVSWCVSSLWSVPSWSLALVGWVCLSLGEKDPQAAASPRRLAALLLGIGALLGLVDLLTARAALPIVAPACLLCGAAAATTLLLARRGRPLSEAELFVACAPPLLRGVAMGAGGALPRIAVGVLLAGTAVAIVVTDALRERGRGEGEYAALLRRALDALAARELSARESEVLVRTLCGETRRTIAGALGVSESTVGTNRTRGYEKLGVSTKAELVEIVGAWTGSEAARRADAPSHGWPTWLRVLLACVLWCLALTPWPASMRDDVALLLGSALCCAALVALLALPSDAGGARALRRLTSARPSWERGVAAALCAATVPPLVVGSWPCVPGRRALALGISALTVLYLGASPVGSDPEARPTTWARRFVRAGLRELACRGREVIGLAGVAFLASAGHASALAPSPGVLDGLWLLAGVLVLLVFGVAFRPRLSDEGEELELLRRAGLSELQARVALALSRGDSERAVCERLHVAPGTVKSARTRCYRALDVHSAAELRKYLEGRAGLTDFAEEHPRG